MLALKLQQSISPNCGGLCGNPSDTETRQGENRLTTHLGVSK